MAVKRERRADEKRDKRRWKQLQRRLEKQKAEANRARDGRMGAASAVRRLDPVTGEVIEVLAKTKVRFDVPKVARGEAERGDKHALEALARAGRDGAPAAWLADTRVAGEAKGISLVKRGLAVVTRSNRFMLTKWADKASPPLVAWDEQRKEADGRRIGMVEPPPLPPQPAITAKPRQQARQRGRALKWTRKHSRSAWPAWVKEALQAGQRMESGNDAR
jgi:hypothetical protein